MPKKVGGQTCVSPTDFFKEIKMSKIINIKGKEISEDTIIEALKKHCGFEEEPDLKAGDIVRNAYGTRIIVKDIGGLLMAYNLGGLEQADETNSAWKNYKKIGTLSISLNSLK